MLIIRQGSTPTITIGIPEDDNEGEAIDMEKITNAWVYIYDHAEKILVDKKMSADEVTKDDVDRILSVRLEQKETLALPLGSLYIQAKLYFGEDATALPSEEYPVRVLPDGKKEVISNEN